MPLIMDELLAQAARMAQVGIRRLLVISGEAAWCEAQAMAFRHAADAEVLWVSMLVTVLMLPLSRRWPVRCAPVVGCFYWYRSGSAGASKPMLIPCAGATQRKQLGRLTLLITCAGR